MSIETTDIESVIAASPFLRRAVELENLHKGVSNFDTLLRRLTSFETYCRKNNSDGADHRGLLKALIPDWCPMSFVKGSDGLFFLACFNGSRHGKPWRGHRVAFTSERLEPIVEADRFSWIFWDDEFIDIFGWCDDSEVIPGWTVGGYARLIKRIRDAYVADHSHVLTSQVA
jgi:hypothetical protein